MPRRRLLRAIRTAAVSVAGATVIMLVLRRLWTEVNPEIAVGIGAIILVGLMLCWANRADAGARSGLGATLLAGTVVAVAVFGAQAELDARRQEAIEQQTLRLTLGLQQDLTGIDLAEEVLAGFHLHGKKLTKARLAHTDLSLAVLSEADLSDADLTRAILSGADLSGAGAARAILSGADLSEADLFLVNLSEANLIGADLSGSYPIGADLSRADLTGADLSGADLTGADLEGAILERAVATGDTLWPEDFDWHAAGVIELTQPPSVQDGV